MLVTSWDHESRDRVEKEENEQVKRELFKARGHLLLRPRESSAIDSLCHYMSPLLFGEWLPFWLTVSLQEPLTGLSLCFPSP